MMQDKDHDEIIVRDLGSTNGIRINGQRVEMGKLRPGDELSIAHIRYKIEAGHAEEQTLAETMPAEHVPGALRPVISTGRGSGPISPSAAGMENPLAAAVREMLPASMADRCRIQVIVQMPPDDSDAVGFDGDSESRTPESDHPCPPDSSP